MGVPELVERISMQARADMGDFLRLLTPEDARAAIEACGADRDRAKRVLRAIEGTGFAIDVEQGIRAGKGAHVKSVSVEQTPEGLPKVKVEVRDPLPALALLAKIRGLTRDQPPPPPPRRVTVNLILKSLPLDVLERLHAQLEAADAQQRAIPAEAQRV